MILEFHFLVCLCYVTWASTRIILLKKAFRFELEISFQSSSLLKCKICKGKQLKGEGLNFSKNIKWEGYNYAILVQKNPQNCKMFPLQLSMVEKSSVSADVWKRRFYIFKPGSVRQQLLEESEKLCCKNKVTVF